MTLTTAASGDTNSNDLKGVDNVDGKESDGSMYVLNYKAAIGVGFYKLASGKKLGYGKAYLDNSSAPNYMNFDEDETTEINSIENGKLTVESSEVYNLAGQRMAHPTQKDLYIVNGKKIVVK